MGMEIILLEGRSMPSWDAVSLSNFCRIGSIIWDNCLELIERC